MKFILAIFLVFGFASTALAEKTLSEKADSAVDATKRGLKKGYHRTAEAFCGTLTGDSKAECLAKKAKNRAEEGADVVRDKASEAKDAIDSD